jgi:hypothetical protein
MLIVKTRLSVTTDLSACLDFACEHRASFFVHLSDSFLYDISGQANKYFKLLQSGTPNLTTLWSFVTPPTNS